MEEYFVGIDVGTSSARAALVDKNGTIREVAVVPIKTWNPMENHFQQSSQDIWSSCCKAVQEVSRCVDKGCVKGIAFDATCSLVAVDKAGQPVSVSFGGERDENVILWLDHRAASEAAEINSLAHPLLRYVGGKVSLEMQLPKLLWLKRHLTNQCWHKAHYFFDLADFLSWKATNCNSRSLCTVVCKWLYDGQCCKWDEQLFVDIGLDDLLADNCRKIGSVVLAPGEPCGEGLSEAAARDLGLLKGTCVSTSIIDAHAGVLGLIGAKNADLPTQLDRRLSVICGTSTCHMALSEDALFAPGVWGPYCNVLGMGFWLNEGGQSATGKLLDHVIDIHPATSAIRQKLPKEKHIMQYLNELIYGLAEKRGVPYGTLTSGFHVWPDFHGNRSPLADSTLRGMITGVSLSSGEEDLALVYLSTVQALAYGTKHIMDSLERAGHKGVTSVVMCGGLGQNQMFVQTHADVIGCSVLVPREQQSVLLGAAMLAATAHRTFATVEQAVHGMRCMADVIQPNITVSQYHMKKYNVFLRMVDDQKEYNRLMNC